METFESLDFQEFLGALDSKFGCQQILGHKYVKISGKLGKTLQNASKNMKM